jgi:Nitroreductase
MEETLMNLKTRRSCRKFKTDQVQEEVLDKILEAGTYAPTGMGKQSPIMIVIQDKDTLEKLSKMNAEVAGMTSDPFYGAPTVVVVLADKNVPTYLEDGSLVMGNLMNAAHALGVDSCYVYRAKQVFESEEGKFLLQKWGVNGDYVGIGNCILGYGDETAIKPAAPRKSNYIIRV